MLRERNFFDIEQILLRKIHQDSDPIKIPSTTLTISTNEYVFPRLLENIPRKNKRVNGFDRVNRKTLSVICIKSFPVALEDSCGLFFLDFHSIMAR